MANAEEAISDCKSRYDLIIISDALLYKIFDYPREAIPKRYWKLKDFYEDLFNNYQPIKIFMAQANKSSGPAIRIYRLR